MIRVPGFWDTKWITDIIPSWCHLCALIQLLCSTDILSGALSVPHELIQNIIVNKYISELSILVIFLFVMLQITIIPNTCVSIFNPYDLKKILESQTQCRKFKDLI